MTNTNVIHPNNIRIQFGINIHFLDITNHTFINADVHVGKHWSLIKILEMSDQQVFILNYRKIKLSPLHISLSEISFQSMKEAYLSTQTLY